MEASKSYIFAGVILPDALPYITAGLRTAVSIALVVILEMLIRSVKELIQLISNLPVTYQIPEMYGRINHHRSHRVRIE